MERPKQDTEAGLKLPSKLPESRVPRSNYVAIFARDEKGEPKYRLIGKPVSQTEHEVIFTDQDGQVYYLCDISFLKLICLTYVANERLARLAQRPVSQRVSETGCN
jgi:hypothetical protein